MSSVYLTSLHGNTKVLGNRFLDNEAWSTIRTNYTRHVLLESNLFEFFGKPKSANTAIQPTIENDPMTIRHNTIIGYDVGGHFFRSHQPLTFQGNVWANNRRLGLWLTEGRKKVSMKGEIFHGNSSANLRYANHHGEIVIEDSGFSTARPAGENLNEGLPKSAGIGILAHSMGLLRWVFAKNADYPCSPTKKGFVKPLKDGWTMRAVRVPSNFDPCKLWSYGSLYRTEGERIAQSRCAKECPGQGCRWVWEDVGVGASAGKGTWAPKKALQCVPKGTLDSCTNPHSFEKFPLKNVFIRLNLNGECVKLNAKDDPCIGKACTAGGEICARFLITIGGDKKLAGICNDERGLKGCRPLIARQYPCKPGYYCFESYEKQMPFDPYPITLSLKNSVFWDNQGIDLFFDMAGKVQLNDNLYLSCVSTSGGPCAGKVAYRLKGGESSISAKREWEEVTLPKGASIVWQNPSPFDAPYASDLQGNDLTKTLKGSPVLYKPGACQSISAQ